MTGTNLNNHSDTDFRRLEELNTQEFISRNIHTEIKNQTFKFLPDTYSYFSTDNNFDPTTETVKWLDNKKVIRSNDPKNNAYFHNQKIEKSEKHIGFLNCCNLNIPHYKDVNAIMKECTVIRPDVDIWTFSEMYAEHDLFFPAGYVGYHSENGSIKTTSIMVKDEINENVEKLPSTLNETRIRIKLGPKKTQNISIIAIYRSPSKMNANSSFAKDLKIENCEVIFDFYKNLFESINEASENTYVFGDLNWATMRKFAKNRNGERAFYDYFKNLGLKNIFGKEITFNPIDQRCYKPTSIDIGIMKTHESNIISKKVNEEDFSQMSDHFATEVVFRCVKRIKV